MSQSILFTQVQGLISQGELIPSGSYVAVQEGIITYVGANRPEGAFQREISCQGKFLMSGLVNAHTHLPMTLLRGLGGGLCLQNWLEDHIFPAEAKLDGRAVRCGTALAIAELLASGCTCVADMYNFSEDIATVVEESGFNANLSRGVLCFDPEAKPEDLEGIQETLDLIDHWHHKNKGQIQVDLSLHAEYTSYLNPAVWDYLHKLGEERGLRIHIHISETKSEHEECKERHGKTPLQILHQHGLWNQGGLAAHCVWTEESDWDLMIQQQISPVHNPISNLKLASGVAPIPSMMEKGVNVVLGTDGVASNNNHDMWEEIKMTAILHKGVNLNPQALTSAQVLDMATRQGGIALGRKTGEVKVGFDADLILVDTTGVSMIPCHDILENLVFSARGSDVSLTMCRGKILYEDGMYTTLDIPALKKELKDYALPRILEGASS